jgi:hypothetical protein
MQEINNHTTHASSIGYLGTNKEINTL